MHTPANGSPVFNRTRRISPTLAASEFDLEKRAVRAPVGSRTDICAASKSFIGALKTEAGDGGGGRVFIFLLTIRELAMSSSKGHCEGLSLIQWSVPWGV